MVVETRYAQSGDVYIAYQISGQDGPDLLAAPGPMPILFAATYPERVAGLILFGTYARTVGAAAK